MSLKMRHFPHFQGQDFNLVSLHLGKSLLAEHFKLATKPHIFRDIEKPGAYIHEKMFQTIKILF